MMSSSFNIFNQSYSFLFVRIKLFFDTTKVTISVKLLKKDSIYGMVPFLQRPEAVRLMSDRSVAIRRLNHFSNDNRPRCIIVFLLTINKNREQRR